MHVQPGDRGGYARYLTPLPTTPRRGVSLRVLGALVQLALMIDVVASVLLITGVFHQRTVVQNAVDRPGDVTLAEVHAADVSASRDQHFLAWAAIVTALLLIGWLTVARRNAQRFDPYIHHHATPWAVFGWIVPVVSFWFPYQIMRDTLAASDREPTEYPRDPRYPLLRAWWTTWLVSLVGWRLVALHHADTPAAFMTHTTLEIAILVSYLAAAVLAAMVVGRISASNDRFRAKLQALATASAD